MNINRLSALVCACTLSLSLLTGCGTQPADTAAGDGRLRVLTSFYPMYDFACKIGGDCIDVTNMVPSGTEPHDWEPSTNDLKNLEKADVFIYNGADMEPWADDLLVSRSDTLSPLPNKTIVVAHEAFGYLCAAYGLEQVGIEELSPDSEPDPGRMAEVIDFVRANNVRTIFFEELVSPKVAQTIASETGAEAKMLNPYEGLSDEQLAADADYFSVMRDNLAALTEALK